MPTRREILDQVISGQGQRGRSDVQTQPRVEAQEQQSAPSAGRRTAGQRISDAVAPVRDPLASIMGAYVTAPGRALGAAGAGIEGALGLGGALMGASDFADERFENARRVMDRMTGPNAGVYALQGAGGSQETSAAPQGSGRNASVGPRVDQISLNATRQADAQRQRQAQAEARANDPLNIAQGAGRTMVSGLDRVIENNPMTISQLQALMGQQRDNIGTLTGTIPEQPEPLPMDEQVMGTMFELLMEDSEVAQMMNDPRVTPEERAALTGELLEGLYTILHGDQIYGGGGLGRGQ